MSTITTPTTPTVTLTNEQYLGGLPDPAEHTRLLFGVLQVSLHAVLFAEAGLLRPAERQLIVRDHERVHPRVPRFQLLDRAVGGGHAPGPDRRAEAELRVVAQPDSLVEVLDLPHRQRRA